jgi:fluoride exporter
VAEDIPFEQLPIDPDYDRHDEPPADPARPSPQRLQGGVLLAIGLGGFAGGLARYELAKAFPSGVTQFPWSTFAINVSGAFGLAVVLVVAIEVLPVRYLRPAVGTGFFGGFTTWSTYMVQTDQLLSHHRTGLAAAYLLMSAAAGLLAAAAGLLGARLLLRRHPASPGSPA